MNDIRIFENEEFGKVRTIFINGEPWLVGNDIAVCLGYAKPRNAVARHVDDEDKALAPFQGGCSTGIQNTVVINESGFYSLVLASKLPNAKRFKRWVTSEVLPTIRRTGGYVSNEDMFAETYLPFADEPVKELFKIQCRYINQLNERIRRDEPKVKFAEHVANTNGLIDMNGMAKICADHGICIGRNRLFAWLRMRGILMANNLPYQEYVDRGHFKVKESVFERGGKRKVYLQTYVTGKGQQFILSKLMGEFGGDG